MPEYFFTCSIGPVQGFIAAARSSRDLAYGSWLLSELAKTAARTIAAQEGFDALIFPAPENENDLAPGSELSVANKVVAVVRKKDPRALAEDIEEALRQYVWNAWVFIEKRLGKGVDADLARWQLDDLIEYYWAAAPFDNVDEYRGTRDRCEAALNARKVTRDFGPYQGTPRFKSSIDGWREHVLSRSSDYQRPPAPDLQRFKLRKGELLSGVDLLKRLGGQEASKVKRYPSVSHLAALPFAEGLGEQRADELKQRLIRLFQEQGAEPVRDYSVFFPSEVRAAVEKKQAVEWLLREQERLLTEYAGQRRPGSYYALLLADGDFMGKTIDAQETPETHRELSQALSKFAKEVPRIVARHKGVAIYSGGDDVLAYLPLHTALDCVGELAERFAQAMAGFTFTDDDGREKSPTLSAGLVIAHHLEPLSDVLALARRTEKAAKSVPGKNTLAITLNKRSGAERTIKQKLPVLIKRLQTMTRWWLDGTLSKGTAYELEHLARKMGDVLDRKALRVEAIRILKRKRESGGGQGVRKEIIEKMEKWLEELEEHDSPLGELAQEMIIADEFTRAMEQAQG